MKIDKILFVSDDNINYLGFWNSISKFYKRYFNITPKLFFIGEKNKNNEIYLSTEYGEVEIVKPLIDIPIIVQALWGKFWFTQTEPETTWLIGDIDLYLLNKNYINNCLENINEDEYVHLNANGYKQGDWWTNSLPGYFHCAKGKKFKDFLKLSDSFKQDCEFIIESKKYGILNTGLINKKENAPERVKDKLNYEFICCEENLSTEKLIPLKNKIISFTYPDNLIRLETQYAMHGLSTPNNFNLKTIFNEHLKNLYIDFHCPRPYSFFSKDIEYILNKYE